MEVLFSTTLKPMADFEVGEIGLCNFGRGAELAMLVIKLEEDLGFATNRFGFGMFAPSKDGNNNS